MRVRIQRIVAFVIDWNIILFPFVFVFFFLATFVQQMSDIGPFVVLLMFLVIVSAFGVFALRDVIFKGRSLGKRIFGLYVYDQKTLVGADAKQRFLRNLFFFLYFIDGILLLATGRTIGDRVAGTVVMSEQGLEAYAEERQYALPVSGKKKLKKVLVFCAVAVGCLIAFMGLIQLVLNGQKDTEEYKLAYHYLIESQAFKELDVDESQIRLNQYSSYTSDEGHSVIQTAELGFLVDFQSFEVVCHRVDGEWQICDACTLFE